MRTSPPLLAAAWPAAAQDAMLDGMRQGLSMLELRADQAFGRYGIEADPRGLTLGQLAAIHGILSGDEPEGQKRQRVETIARR